MSGAVPASPPPAAEAPESLAQQARSLAARGLGRELLSLLRGALGEVPAEALRTLADRLLPVPRRLAGRPFASLPPTSERFELGRHRPLPSPDGTEWLVPCADGWFVFAVQGWQGQRVVGSDSGAPATWFLDPDAGKAQILFSRGHELCVVNPTDSRNRLGAGEAQPGNPELVWRAPEPILGLRASPSGAVAIATEPRAALSPDLYVASPRPRRLRYVPNVSLWLDADGFALADALFCVGAGLQPAELRLVDWEGGWRTRTLHSEPLRLLAPSSDGATLLSIDASGRALFWRDASQQPFASTRLASLPLAADEPCAGLWVDAGATLWLCGPERELTRVRGDGCECLSGWGLGPVQPGSLGIAPFARADGWYWLEFERAEAPALWHGDFGLGE